jgi:hypothetical protein
MLDMHVKPRLLPGEEVQTKAPDSQEGWTHTRKVTEAVPGRRRGLTRCTCAAAAVASRARRLNKLLAQAALVPHQDPRPAAPCAC